MQDYIARRPIADKKATVCGYRLIYGHNTENLLNETVTGYTEFGPVTQSLFFDTIGELADHTAAYLDFTEGLADIAENCAMIKESDNITILFARGINANAAVCGKLKSKGFKLAFDSSFFTDGDAAAAFADIMVIEFTKVSLAVQTELIKKYKDNVIFLADKIETWSDYKVSKDMGYALFQGYFFLWPSGGLQQREIKALDVNLVSILAELDRTEPDFNNMSDIIEHDLGLSYKLLRLVNSAYMAPKYRIKSISHALTYLGTRELYQWISMLMFSSVKNSDNSELIKMSLIRGKLMALAAQELGLSDIGSEPFFTGLFSLIDVILNRDINDLLIGLPFSEDVKSALRGESNALQSLLTFVISYEQADWQKIEGKYPLSKITPQKMVTLCIEAHKWANLADN